MRLMDPLQTQFVTSGRESRGCHASQECAVARFLCPGTTVTYSLSPTAGLKCDVSRSICRFLDLYVV